MRTTTLGETIERNARFFPDRIAAIAGSDTLSFSALRERGLRLASALHQRGVRRQDRVAMLSFNSLEYCEFYAAAALAGMIATTVNFRLAAPEIAHVLADSGSRALIFQAAFADEVEKVRAAFPDLRLIRIGPGPDWAEDYEAVLAAGDATGPGFAARSEDISHLIYTSGTTGRPKGVARSHRGALAYADCMVRDMWLSFDTRYLVLAPMFHIGGGSHVAAVHEQAGLCVMEPQFDPVRTLELIERHRITHIFMVPAMMEAVLDAAETVDSDLSSLQRITLAGAPVPAPTVRRAHALVGRVLMIQYGMTEAVGTVLYPDEIIPDGSAEESIALTSVGRPTRAVDLTIRDEDGQECPVGLPGEIWLRSNANMDFYWNNGGATIDTLRDGWVLTGDVGYADERGLIFLVDRKKDMIISGGENVYSREVEEALITHPALREVAVIGVPDARWGEAVVAVAVCKAGEKASEKELIEHSRALIARYKCPKAVMFTDALPRVASGKIDKVAIRAQYSGTVTAGG